MVSVETRKDLPPVLRIYAVIAFSHFRQVGLSLDSKSMRLITAVRCLQHETIILSAIMHQLAANDLCTVPFDQLVNMRTAAG